ncbi:hypothetical protein HYH03_003276 [Edaphochlamys debaryana]|uniref:non-specific serine/threonine protein kinase n=1 Tax=Edaphochlamys debaryana TaxID=47281 RepID=A0A836C4N6_9CHLO|nr:hypothetical protein HYH03_003276 [Edaphochlamys debaryana]|eukprot:KAG2499093.1 hypothetical protein HYH03_003276 [Edaphochlamys debaryana]
MPAVLKLLLPSTRYLDYATEVEGLKCMWGASGSVQLLAAGTDFSYKGTTWRAILLDYCDGGSLEDLMDARLKQQGGGTLWGAQTALLFDEATLRLLMRQLLGALAQVHAANMIHLDIKPANLLLKRGEIKISGKNAQHFGCAVKRSSRGGRFETEGGGTMLYMAKEVRDARKGVVSEDGINEKADVFSAGCVLAQMAFVHGSSALYAFTRHMNIRPVPGFVSPGLVAYLHRVTDPDPRRRPSVAEALQDQWMQG